MHKNWKRGKRCYFLTFSLKKIDFIFCMLKLQYIQYTIKILLFSGKRANLFTAAMYNTYSPPPGFCFDVLCADEPMIDDPDSPDYNIDKKVRNNANMVIIDTPNDKLIEL